jgi:hypothetical protein
VGLGWTLDTMEIVREVQGTNGQSFNWSNEFTLLYKGTAYKLKPDTGGLAYGHYHTEDEQFLAIERHNDEGNGHGFDGAPLYTPETPVGNRTGEYWIVRLRDGTECRLGYNRDSEQNLRAAWPGNCYGEGCYARQGSERNYLPLAPGSGCGSPWESHGTRLLRGERWRDAWA